MSQNSCSSTCKLPIVGSDLLCIVNSEWSSKCVKLLVLHDNQAWSGKFQVVDDEDTTDLLDQLSMTEENYIIETKKALTTNGGAESFSYTIDSDQFTWKKYITKDMSVKLGYITLEKVSAFSVFEEIIDRNLQENLELNIQLKRASEQNNTYTKENEHLKTKLNELIEKKAEMESSLYSQFVYLLNEKKRRINELQKQCQPTCEEENERGSTQSDSDPFGSDTELDSEEEKQSPSKVENQDGAEGDKVCMLPKRLTTPSKKVESVAGPSGICQKSKNNRSASKSPSKNVSNNSKITKTPQGKSKKPLKFSCVMGEISDNKELQSSEEDVFMFPKRSKKISRSVELVKPSTSNIKYDSNDEMPLNKTQKIETNPDSKPSTSQIKYNSDDEMPLDRTQKIKTDFDSKPSASKIKYNSDDEMPLDKTQKIETESDSTPSGIDSIDVINTSITVKNPEDINSKVANSISDERNNVKFATKTVSDNSKSKRSEIVEDSSFKDYSNSTLDILNQLV